MKKILFVDDDKIHLAIIENILENEFEIITANSGKEALNKFIKGLTPHLIFLDLLMPNMDGWETYNRLKAISLLKNIPIAFFTSVQETNEKAYAFRIGAVDYIRKPFEKEVLKNKIEMILEKSNGGMSSW